MFDEAQVCMVCGRPVDAVDQVYCSVECSTLDATSSPIPSSLTSPSLSATSSACPSPYIRSTTDCLDVPALVPSTLGHGHSHKYSISSSSNSSVGCSTSDDLTDASIAIQDPSLDPPCENAKSPHLLLHPAHAGMMQYARRPSATNHRSTVPLLLRNPSGMTMSSPSSASSFGVGKSMPSPLYPTDGDDDGASSVCLSEEGDHHSRVSSSTTADRAQARRKRNRASLPAYFSLLHGHPRSPSTTTTAQLSSSALSSTSTKTGEAAHQSQQPSSPGTTTRHWRTPSALAQLSRSLQLASPTTPRVSHATVSANSADFTHANSPTSVKTERAVVDSGVESLSKREETLMDRTRGRARTRDPYDVDARRSTRSVEGGGGGRRGERRSPFPARRPQPPARHQQQERGRARMSAAQRARIDSVEKVAEWVSSSPVVNVAPVPLRPASYSQNAHRRNSSPEARRVKYEFVEALTRGLRGCAVGDSDDESEEEEEEEVVVDAQEKENVVVVRGRRRVGELDVPPSLDAPGLGSGRSGLKAREGGRC
ncbi:hypothetical protein BC835DRAFT_1523332 [Cytidiella melzeri]|nr:hypothetical protein BC835DRAFT_1523332 [Cytidiella melzeri]